jgi:hypothetical protein
MGHVASAPGATTKIPGPDQRRRGSGGRHETKSNLKVQLNGGYYDLATPYFAAVYELRQLPIQEYWLRPISRCITTSGHMVYAHEPDLKALHGMGGVHREDRAGPHGK